MSTSPLMQFPVLPFSPAQEKKSAPETIASDHSLLEIDRELDVLFDQMEDELEENGAASPESVARFHAFCDAYGEKVDRIGRFIRVMEARTAYCKAEAARLVATCWGKLELDALFDQMRTSSKRTASPARKDRTLPRLLRRLWREGRPHRPVHPRDGGPNGLLRLPRGGRAPRTRSSKPRPSSSTTCAR